MQASAYHNQLSAVFCCSCLSFALMPGSSDSLSPWELLCGGLVIAFVVLLFTAVSCLIYEGMNLPQWIKGLLLLLLCCGWKPVLAFMKIWSCSLAWDWTDVWELVTGSVMLFCWPAVGAIVAWRLGSAKRWFSLLCIIAGILLLLYGISPEPDGSIGIECNASRRTCVPKILRRDKLELGGMNFIGARDFSPD